MTIVQDGELPVSSTLEAWAQIESLSSVHERARAEAATSIASSSPLTLSIESNTQPLRSSELAQIVLTVTNRDSFTHFGVELTSRIPQSTNQLFESEFDGDCTSTSCTAGERVTWALGNIPAGQSRSVDLPLTATSGAVDGDQLNLLIPMENDSV